MKVKEIKQISYEIYKLIKYTEDVEIKKALRYAFGLIEREIPRNPIVVEELVPSLVHGGEVERRLKCPSCYEELEGEEERCSCNQIIDWND